MHAVGAANQHLAGRGPKAQRRDVVRAAERPGERFVRREAALDAMSRTPVPVVISR